MDSKLEQVISILSSGIVRRKAANGIDAQKKIEKTGIARKATRKKRGK